MGATLQVLYFEFGIAFTQLVLILLPAVLFLRRHHRLDSDFTRLKMFEPRQLPLLVIIMVCALVIVLGYGVVLEAFFERLGWEIPDFFPPPQTLDMLLMYYLLIAVLPGICEEYLFRGTIMPFLEPHGLLPALFFSSLLFGIFHLSLVRLPGTFFLGLVIGLVVIKTGSLLAGMFLHFLNNAAALTFMYYAAAMPQPPEYDTAAEQGAVFLVLVPLAAVGLYFCIKKLGGRPVLGAGQKIMPRGWFNVAMAVSLVLFLIMAVLEVIVLSGILEQLMRMFMPY